MPYVNHRWLGGMLTNFKTIIKRVVYLNDLNAFESSGEINAYPKPERLRIRREIDKLTKSIGGIANMNKLPEAIFIVDLLNETTALTEASKLDIPIIGLADSNVDPENVDFVIGDITNLPFEKESISNISSLSVIEHIGLGRYGDKIDLFGNLVLKS